MARPAIIAASIALAACGQAATMPAKPPKPAAPTPEAKVLLVTPAAVGPATAATPFERNPLQRLFRGGDVSAEFDSEEGEQIPVIMVLGPGDLSIRFTGQGRTLERAFITGSAVRGPKGEKIGDRFSASGFTRKQCVEGADRYAATLICRRPRAGELGFVFAPADAPDPELREFYWLAVAP
jgi:hypothetical protein